MSLRVPYSLSTSSSFSSTMPVTSDVICLWIFSASLVFRLEISAKFSPVLAASARASIARYHFEPYVFVKIHSAKRSRTGPKPYVFTQPM